MKHPVAFCLLITAGIAADGLEEYPLTPRSTASGSTLFTELPASRTGIVATNNYDDPRMWGDLYRELTFGTMGTGVAIGDYDNDGRPDLFVASKTETSRLFRNLGDWQFADVTAAAGLAVGRDVAQGTGFVSRLFGDNEDGPKPWEQGVTFADIDNDGDLDLYVCRYGAPNRLYVNQGDGTFTEEAAVRGLAVVDGSGVGAFCDYDRDGWLDVYVQTNMMDYANFPDGRRDYLFRNNGDGTFANVTTAAGISGATAGHSATWCDFDADGWPDLWVANDFATPDQYYRNNRDGTFTNVINETASQLSYYSMGADFADVNGDCLFDLYVADMATTRHEKDQRSMAGSRVRGQKIDEGSPVPPQYMRNALHLNTGTGRFREGAWLAGLSATDWTWSIRFEDFDNDGRVDLHVTNGMNREYHSADLLEQIVRSENPSALVRIMQESPVMAEQNLAFRNDGDLRFTPVTTDWGLDRTGVSFGTATGDLDGDGDLDLVYANYQGAPAVFRNDSTVGRRTVIALRGTASSRFGTGAVVRIRTAAGEQIRQLIPSRGYLSCSQPVVHFGLGAAERIERLSVLWPSGREQVFTDLQVDRRFVITEPAESAGMVQTPAQPQESPLFREVGADYGLDLAGTERVVDEPNGQSLLPFRFNRPGPDIAVGEITGDTWPDLVVAGTSAEPPRTLVGTAAGRFNVVNASLLAGDTGLAMGPLLLFDADGDGLDDLLVTRTGANTQLRNVAYQPTLFFNRNGFTAAPEGTLPEVPLSVGAVAALDFDRDGDLDLFIGGRNVPGSYPTSPPSVLLRNDGGTFADVTPETLRAPGMVTAAVATDLDADGWTDLVLATDWGTVTWLRNDGAGGFADRTMVAGFAAAGTGWWRSLAVADFNGDGRPDVAAGNVGLNTPYQASADSPLVVFLGNFTGRSRGAATLVEAYYENGVLYPRRERKDLSSEIRTLQRRFRRATDYASAPLDQVLDPEQLAAAERWEAAELRSGIFLSAADGTWRFQPWPRIAQIAPAESMVAGDFDADGDADLYVVQNDYAPIDFVGRFAGGLSQLLEGDGTGYLAAVDPATSGLIVPGDAQGVVTLDLDRDDRPDFFVTRSNAPALAFRRQDN